MQLTPSSPLWRVALICWWLICVPPSPARAAGAPAEAPPGYHAVYLEADGRVLPESLDLLTADIRFESQSKPAQVILLVHGYNTSYTLGRRQYRRIARLVRKEALAQGWRPVVVGVHWPSYPGPPARWLPQMLGYRFLSAAGFPNAVTNPYLEKVAVASQAGRTGLRAVLFRLRDEFPAAGLHVFAHSMGSELTVRALAPFTAGERVAVEQPSRTLRLGMVTLAGADLDQDAFAPEGLGSVPAALDRARVWWITVPRKNTADAALELRRAAGRRDAMGNVGLTLARGQLNALLTRRGLVIDNRSVPITHDITDYFTGERLRGILASLRYLSHPETTEGQGSVLATLDRILKADPTRLPTVSNVRGASARLYIRWRREPNRNEYGSIRSASDSVETRH
ncbi:MAG: alpha/beta hydrolase [Actinomycetota bacterium]